MGTWTFKWVSLVMIGCLTFHYGHAQVAFENAIVKTAVSVYSAGKLISESTMMSYVSHDSLKIELRSSGTFNDVYINRKEKKSTSLYEIMGKKLGFYILDTNETQKAAIREKVQVSLLDSSKSINGFDCKLAVLHLDSAFKMDDISVWYFPEMRFADSTMGINVPGIERIPGVPILINVSMPNGLKTVYTLLDIDRETPVDPAVFTIPKGYSIMTLQEFQREVQQMSKG